MNFPTMGAEVRAIGVYPVQFGKVVAITPMYNGRVTRDFVTIEYEDGGRETYPETMIVGRKPC